jgi:hypothetical protein
MNLSTQRLNLLDAYKSGIKAGQENKENKYPNPKNDYEKTWVQAWENGKKGYVLCKL